MEPEKAKKSWTSFSVALGDKPVTSTAYPPELMIAKISQTYKIETLLVQFHPSKISLKTYSFKFPIYNSIMDMGLLHKHHFIKYIIGHRLTQLSTCLWIKNYQGGEGGGSSTVVEKAK